MPEASDPWGVTCIEPVDPGERLDHVRYCSPFAAGLIDRHPDWLEQLRASGRLDETSPPQPARAGEWVSAYGLDDGLRAFRNQEMLRIAWRDLCGLKIAIDGRNDSEDWVHTVSFAMQVRMVTDPGQRLWGQLVDGHDLADLQPSPEPMKRLATLDEPPLPTNLLGSPE